ncbi:hypothetical protein COB18_03385 [Candidatus Kaiserbacteria bacterium]|nr:MAG: hypothetical protein COB18_03385 [Candidatus Kaiserbacteria bacterium]
MVSDESRGFRSIIDLDLVRTWAEERKLPVPAFMKSKRDDQETLSSGHKIVRWVEVYFPTGQDVASQHETMKYIASESS